jgi:hypothetical protein
LDRALLRHSVNLGIGEAVFAQHFLRVLAE